MVCDRKATPSGRKSEYDSRVGVTRYSGNNDAPGNNVHLCSWRIVLLYNLAGLAWKLLNLVFNMRPTSSRFNPSVLPRPFYRRIIGGRSSIPRSGYRYRGTGSRGFMGIATGLGKQRFALSRLQYDLYRNAGSFSIQRLQTSFTKLLSYGFIPAIMLFLHSFRKAPSDTKVHALCFLNI